MAVDAKALARQLADSMEEVVRSRDVARLGTWIGQAAATLEELAR